MTIPNSHTAEVVKTKAKTEDQFIKNKIKSLEKN